MSLDGVNATLNSYNRELDGAIGVLRTTDEGKQYYFAAGLHAAIVRCTEDAGLEYLEMQAANPKLNTWHPLTVDALKQRFKCRVSEDRDPNAGTGSSVRMRNVFMADIDTFQGSEEFADIVGYINTRVRGVYEETEAMQHPEWYKEKPTDRVWWKYEGEFGKMIISFDKCKEYNLFTDYPHNMAGEEVAIFDKENPYWAKFFADRKEDAQNE